MRHIADLQLAGQPHPCHRQASAGQPVQDEALVAIQVGLAGMKNRLYRKKNITETPPSLCLLRCYSQEPSQQRRMRLLLLQNRCKGRARHSCRGGQRGSCVLAVEAHLPRSCFWPPVWEEREGCVRNPPSLWILSLISHLLIVLVVSKQPVMGSQGTPHTAGTASPRQPRLLATACSPFPLPLSLGTEI